MTPNSGLVEDGSGNKKLVVTGGLNGDYITTTEELDLNTLQWSVGKDLPIGRDYGASVQFKDSFLIVAGNGPAGYTDTILEYNTDSGDWNVRSERLLSARGFHAAFLVPEEIANCS